MCCSLGLILPNIPECVQSKRNQGDGTQARCRPIEQVYLRADSFCLDQQEAVKKAGKILASRAFNKQ